jgi:hypothetical protein
LLITSYLMDGACVILVPWQLLWQPVATATEVPHMSERTAESRPVMAWMDVLSRIEESLQQSLTLATESPNPPAQGHGSGAAALRVLDERLANWQGCQDRASEEAAQADAQAAIEEAALTEIIQKIATVREKLTTWGKRPA